MTSEEKAMAPHSSTLAWKIPWMEEPGRLQSMGSLRVRHDWATSLSLFTFLLPGIFPIQRSNPGSIPRLGRFPWRRNRLPTLAFLGFSGSSDCKESTCNAGDLGLISGLERSLEEGNGNPLQYSCLKNPMDRAWWATAHGFARSQTRLNEAHTTRCHFEC